MLRELLLQYKKKWWLWALFISFIVLCLVVSAIKADRIFTSYVDFSGFYMSGWHFANGNPLYGHIYKWIMPYYYLPFMAMFFSTLTLIYIKYSTFIYFSLNILLTPLIYFYILKILKLSGYNWKQIKVPFILSLLLSLRYIGTNYDLGQINVFVFIFILLGFINVLKNNENKSLIFFSIAAVIKIIPVLLLFWYFIKRPSLKAIYIPLIILAIAILLPVPFRGMEQSLRDLQDFYYHVLQKHLLSSEIFYRFTNQSLSAALARVFFPPEGENFHVFPYLNIAFNEGKFIILITRLALLVSFIYIIIRFKKAKQLNLLPEFALVLLFIHLISSLTWKNHLVTMSLAFVPFFIEILSKKSIFSKILISICFLFFLFLSFNYASLVGYQLSNIVGSYSLYFLMILFLYIYYYNTMFKNIFNHSTC